MTVPERVNCPVASRARTIPKSMTRGPTGDSSTLEGLRVAIYHLGLVDGGQGRRDADRERVEIGSTQRAVGGHRLLQARAVDEVGGDPQRVLVQSGVQNWPGAEPPHAPRRCRFLPEPLPELGLTRQFGVDDLHRDPPSAAVFGKPHRAHPAAASRRTTRYGPIISTMSTALQNIRVKECLPSSKGEPLRSSWAGARARVAPLGSEERIWCGCRRARRWWRWCRCWKARTPMPA